MLNTTLLWQGTSFPCTVEFSDESWTLPISAEYLRFHGMLWNSVPNTAFLVRFRQP